MSISSVTLFLFLLLTIAFSGSSSSRCEGDSFLIAPFVDEGVYNCTFDLASNEMECKGTDGLLTPLLL